MVSKQPCLLFLTTQTTSTPSSTWEKAPQSNPGSPPPFGDMESWMERWIWRVWLWREDQLLRWRMKSGILRRRLMREVFFIVWGAVEGDERWRKYRKFPFSHSTSRDRMIIGRSLALICECRSLQPVSLDRWARWVMQDIVLVKLLWLEYRGRLRKRIRVLESIVFLLVGNLSPQLHWVSFSSPSAFKTSDMLDMNIKSWYFSRLG